MNWFHKLSFTEVDRISNNILRLENLLDRVHDLAYFAVASNSGGHTALEGLVQDKIVLGRPKIKDKMMTALVGENNQKIALDSPHRFQQIMFEAENLIKIEINQERKELAKLGR